MEIVEITAYTLEIEEAVKRFLKQLMTQETDITESFLKELIGCEHSYLFCAKDDSGQYIGMLTVGLYLSPTGTKAWIEDVVIDEEHRGKGVGAQLTTHAIHFAEKKGVKLLMLTSNPSRIAANALYQKLGFEQKKTNVYKMVF